MFRVSSLCRLKNSTVSLSPTSTLNHTILGSYVTLAEEDIQAHPGGNCSPRKTEMLFGGGENLLLPYNRGRFVSIESHELCVIYV